mmetsp:Transcript_39590/g.112267  ORF Transcript_39590/g.112267 Transcript_39590/m.112267 type:complete len:467 (+) Transcript_39590:196-1596(+)|eukprot:CAMPEP_0117660150 /NCGR_PEP_ID=MMETSP0804-20121206/6813_1 /TAXON_ID=1074897 /ORGANISM="Tetraselmis astigmatica, Strain CCMP880" /LENGTH=466 /DNA_ID=CAMNT_0005466857 /DNA_START=187 /DNA_END=1587 /DNA_ORIENTATION=-
MLHANYMNQMLMGDPEKHLSSPFIPSQSEFMQSAATPSPVVVRGSSESGLSSAVAVANSYHQLSLPSPSSSSTMSFVDSPSSTEDGSGSGHSSTDGVARELILPIGQAPTDTMSDEFRMYRFKVLLCRDPNCQDWSKCPYAHPDEKATRRDPRVYTYRPEFCQGLRKNTCANGDACSYSHNVFEAWLHPQKYRTQLCKKGSLCDRDVCFFAHSEAELRQVPCCEPFLEQEESQLQKKKQASGQKKRGKTGRTPETGKAQEQDSLMSKNRGEDGTPMIPLTGLLPFPFAQQSALLGQLEMLHAQRVYGAFSCTQINALAQSGAMAELLRSQTSPPSIVDTSLSGLGSPVQVPNLSQLPGISQADVGQFQMAHNLAMQMFLHNNISQQGSPPRTTTPEYPTYHAQLQSSTTAAASSAGQQYSPFMSPQLFGQSLYAAVPSPSQSHSQGSYEQPQTQQQAPNNFSLHVW